MESGERKPRLTKRFAEVRKSRAAFTALSFGAVAVMGMLLISGCAKKEEDAPPAVAPTQPKGGEAAPGASAAPVAAPVSAAPVQPKN